MTIQLLTSVVLVLQGNDHHDDPEPDPPAGTDVLCTGQHTVLLHNKGNQAKYIDVNLKL